MDLVTGAMGNLAPKLLQLLQSEYNLQKGVRKKIQFLSEELESIHAALRKVAAVPPDQLDEQVKIWARQVREASYDMEDILDTFLVHVEGCPKEEPTGHGTLKSAVKRMNKLFTRAKARHDITSAIEDIKKQLQVVAERRTRYRVDEIVSKPAPSSAMDPRLQAMYQKVTQLVGIEGAMGELISMLSLQKGQVRNEELKIVSVLGVGGLGKTTIAKAVYDELKSQFDCGAFVPVGRNPDPAKIFRDILIELDKQKYTDINISVWDQRQLIDELRDFLGSKRYFIVIDDIWEKQIWEIIRLAFKDENRGSRIVLTTRKPEVTGSEVYMPKALSDDNSKRLFHTRIFGGVGKGPYNEVDEVSDKILNKCGGIPLAIITMASLLLGKSMGEWLEVCDSTGFRDKDTMGILSLSYYDLPLHLRTCLLYLSAFPEDHIIDKNSLIWRWIAEDFVQKKEGIGLFEVGEGYFNDLVNRSLIQAVESKHNDIIDGCRVHDMVLDLLCSLSSEENFVTILDNDEGTSSIRSARRLAHQKGTTDARLENNRGMEKLRSLITVRCRDELQFWRFKVLRVLDLENVHMKNWNNSKNLGNLLHLRYLGLKHTTIPELPKEIAALKFLQTLHLVDNFYIKELPSSVGQLTNLVCLHAWGSIHWRTSMPTGIIKKLTSLEELLVQCGEDMYHKYKGQFKELRNLSELRVLTIKVIGMDQSMLSDLLQSVGDLHKIESIELEPYPFCSSLCGAMFDAIMLPQRLRHLLVRVHSFSRFPSSIDPSSLINLTHLELDVIAMDEQSMQILGGLPELRDLVLTTESTVTATNIAVDGFFQKLRSCKFFSSVVLFVLNEDSTVSFTLWNGDDIAFGSRKKGERTRAPTIMPNLQELSFTVKFWSMRKYEGIYGNLGLDYLTSLQKLTVILNYAYCFSEALMTEAEADLRHAIDVHPSHPALIFNRIGGSTVVGINEEFSRRKWAKQSVRRFR